MLICVCSLHATCLDIFLVAGLGLGVFCWLTLGMVFLCGLDLFMLVSFFTLRAILLGRNR